MFVLISDSEDEVFCPSLTRPISPLPPVAARLCPSDHYWSGMTEQFYYINTFFINCPAASVPYNDKSIIFILKFFPSIGNSNQKYCVIKSFTILFPHLSESSKWTPNTNTLIIEWIIILIMEFWCQHTLSTEDGSTTLPLSKKYHRENIKVIFLSIC